MKMSGSNQKSYANQKLKLNGDCGSYNNLFFVWEFKDVSFNINSTEDISDIQA